MFNRHCAGLFRLAAALVLTGCSSLGQDIDAQAAASGFTRMVLTGIGYEHVTYQNQRDGPSLHVYIENDGNPWTSRYAVASDPTPVRPLMLELMALDAEPSVYLGRPCYLGRASTPPCIPLDWTHERYSERIVASMAAALRQAMSARQLTGIVFFGHSGGGTLAVLLAQRFPQTSAVVTLAANLDITAWVRMHGYTPLRGSLNPADQSPLASGILQKHYIGTLDRNVTPDMLRRFAQRQPRAQVIELQGFNHECCWKLRWATVLQELKVDLKH